MNILAVIVSLALRTTPALPPTETHIEFTCPNKIARVQRNTKNWWLTDCEVDGDSQNTVIPYVSKPANLISGAFLVSCVPVSSSRKCAFANLGIPTPPAVAKPAKRRIVKP